MTVHDDQQMLAELRQIAEAATPGRRERLAGNYGRDIGNADLRLLFGNRPGGYVMLHIATADGAHHADAAYETTFSPDVILDLIARAERLARYQLALEAI